MGENIYLQAKRERYQLMHTPVYLCNSKLCDCYSSCEKFHPDIDCEAWILNPKSCDGKCGKSHRRQIEGRKFGKDVFKDMEKHIVTAKSAIVPVLEVNGKITVGVRWDVNEDHFANQPHSGPIRAVALCGKYEDLSLNAGIYDQYGNLLHCIDPDEGRVRLSENYYASIGELPPDRYHFANNAVVHSGDDDKGGPKGRSKQGNYGNNENITMDFSRMPPEVHSIIIGVGLQSSLIDLILNASLHVFQTPESEISKPNEYLAEIPLERQQELSLKKGYIFAKFVRAGPVWHMIPIRSSVDENTSSTLADEYMIPYACEIKNILLPPPMDTFDFNFALLSKDFRTSFPVEIDCICYDFFGNIIRNFSPFETTKQNYSIKMKLRPNSSLKAVLVYASTTITDQEANILLSITTPHQTEPITKNFIALGGPNQYVARLTSNLNGIFTQNWQLSVLSCLIPDVITSYSGSPDIKKRAELFSFSSRLVRINQPRFLNVEVVSGHALAVKDFKSSDPYVVVKFGSEKFSTAIKKSTLNPVWEEVIKFPIYENIPIGDGKITIKCKDWNQVTKHSYMGTGQASLPEFGGPMKEQEIQLIADTKHAKSKVSGFIKVLSYFSEF